MKSFRIHIAVYILVIVIKASSQQQDSLTIQYNYVNSLPQNAEIYVNDSLIGKTPMFFKWEKGDPNRKITVKLEGYAVYEYTPENDEIFVNKTFKLVALTGFEKKEIVFKEKSYSFRKKIKLVPLLISSVITAASAVLAYYYKSKAIDKNDEFIQSGDPALLDKKKKYDLIGGISLAVFQVGFCALIYYHFIDN